MICQFNHQPCQYINCPLWDEGRQDCLFRLAMLKVLAWPAAELGQPPLLTDTERDILVLMADGRHNEYIAYELGIQTKRVSRYVADILAKLDARSRAHAVTIAVTRGIIVLPEDHANEQVPVRDGQS